MNYLLIFILVVFIFWIFLMLKFSKNKKLWSQIKKELEKNFKYIKSSTSSKERVTDFDKLYHKILLKLWYNWTFWEILKSEPKVISNINKIWELHKLRNKLVHDFDFISDNILRKKALEYEKSISELLKRI
jgi:hypothetical protein